MDNAALIVTTVVALGVGIVVYRMGCSTSSVAPDKQNADNTKDMAAIETPKTAKRKAAEEKKYAGGKLNIYFGSQTGTSEGFARVLMEEGKNIGFDAKMHDLEDFDPAALAEAGRAIFLMATYGEGEPTDNAARFIKWLKEEESAPLSNLQFTVFGLGNKQYEHFNRMGKITNSSLDKLGGNRMFEYGEGDDDASLEEDFENWRRMLWPALTARFIDKDGSQKSAEASAYHAVSSAFTLQVVNPMASASAPKIYSSAASLKQVHASSRHFFTAPRAPVTINRELRHGDAIGSTRHLELDLQAVGMRYETADNLAVLPENPSSLVSAFASMQGYQLDQHVHMQGKEEEDEAEAFKAVYPTPCSVQELLTCYLDLQAELKQSTLRALVHYVQDAKERKWLEEMLQDARRPELKALIRFRTLADLMAKQLTSLKVPLEDLLNILPPVQPRYYTISSSALAHPDTVSITVSLTQQQVDGQGWIGLCSGFLNSLQPGSSSARVFVRASSFRLPKSISTPLLLVGPGTGVAPMRAFLQERAYMLSQDPSLRAKAGPIALFFGCRHAEVDLLYKEELQQLLQDGVLTNLYLAVSRDAKLSDANAGMGSDQQVLARCKVYVQNILQEAAVAQQALQWLQLGQQGGGEGVQGAHVYVCGATSMGHDVMMALQSIIAAADSKVADAHEVIKALQDSSRYVQELWST